MSPTLGRAARELIDCADDLISAIDGTTDQFEPQTVALSAAISAAEKAMKPDLTAEQPYTVLLLYPDDIANTYGQDTYLTAVKARGAAEAIDLARVEAAAANDHDEPDDWHCLLCITGEHEDVAP